MNFWATIEHSLKYKYEHYIPETLAVRLRRAAELLNQQNCKINEISWLVGFSNHSYFTKCFTEYFGMLPKEYIAKKVKENNDEPIVLDNTKESSK